MKVKELLAELSTLDPEMEVVLSSDSEGNRYSPLYAVAPCLYHAESTYSGYLRDENEEEVDEYMEDNSVTREEAVKVLFANTPMALVMWPTN